MGISKRRARAGEGGWPSLGLSCFLSIPVPRKNSKSLKKSLYPIFVELGRRAWVWEAYLRGGGIIFIPDILLRYSYRLDIRPSVDPSVCLLSVRPSVRHTLVLCRTAQPVVKLSSLPGSPMILVLWEPNLFPEFQWEHPNGGVKWKGGEKSCNFRPISRYSS